jgi:phosphatidylserine/phosphatidylglycerophosphate/cardiolipin synthase-like enzyme
VHGSSNLSTRAKKEETETMMILKTIFKNKKDETAMEEIQR